MLNNKEAFVQKIFLKITVFLSLNFLSALDSAFAEDEMRGRLPDGRAFRTDNQGNQLVDYIAELELNIEALTRQVRGLESENANNKAIIQRLSKGGQALSNNVSEKNLLKNNSGTNQVDTFVTRDDNNSCDDKLAAQNDEIDLLKQKYQELLGTVSESQSLRQQIAVTKEDNQKLNERIETLQSKISEQDGLIKRYSLQLDNFKNENVVSSAPRASLDLKSENALQQPDKTRVVVVDQLKKRMHKDLASLQSLIAYRNKESSAYSSEEDSQELRELSLKVDNAVMVHELSEARTEINILRGKIQGEIAQLKRVRNRR
jgi:chromosome segregation ATPase